MTLLGEASRRLARGAHKVAVWNVTAITDEDLIALISAPGDELGPVLKLKVKARWNPPQDAANNTDIKQATCRA